MNVTADTATLMKQDTMLSKRVMGFSFLDCPLDDAAALIVEAASAGEKKNIFFVNAHCANVAAQDHAYKSILDAEPFLFADGAGMELAAVIQGTSLDHNVNGTDLFPLICGLAAQQNQPIALLGAAPGVAEACAKNMRQRYPGLKIVSVNDGYLNGAEEARAIQEINSSGAGILFVAKGVPAQEHWIARHRAELETPVILGVGALFDFYSCAVPIAPEVMRKLRIEWLYRFAQEPRRMFRRYIIGNPEFVLRALWMRVTGHGK